MTDNSSENSTLRTFQLERLHHEMLRLMADARLPEEAKTALREHEMMAALVRELGGEHAE